MAAFPQPQQAPQGPERTPNAPAANQTPYMPPGPPPLVFDTYLTVNTQASRVAIDDPQCSWIDGFMPIGKSNARTMPGVGDRVYQNLLIDIIVFDFANIGATPIMIVFLADGSILQVNTLTYVVTTIAAAGTITNPSVSSIGMTQWGSQYVLIVADQENGYWIWDGASLFTAGTIAPEVTITAGGTGYTSGATVSFSGGAGTGAAGTVQVENGIVIGITITSPGSGYVVGNTVTVTITPVGAGSGATATIEIAPFGLSGNAIETYTFRVWIANGPQITFSAPSSFIDFSTSSGGGEFTSTDSFLRVGFSALRQSNGFLYLIGDSSISYISGVQTGGSPITTTFTNQNADPEVGTPYGATVDVLGSNIVMANAWGVHVAYGGKATKRSSMMDGVYNTVPNFGGQALSAAKAIVFGTRIWCLLVPIIDPVTGVQINKLLIWNGEQAWWASNQDVSLIYVQHQEIDSVLTAYGSTGNAIFKLFKNPSIDFQKILQSKLWDRPGQMFVKTANRLWGMANYYSIEAPEIQISIDNENSAASVDAEASPAETTWFNDNGDEVPWVNNSGDLVTWFASGSGISVFGPIAIAQQGRLIGYTVSTFAADMAMISIATDDQIAAYAG